MFGDSYPGNHIHIITKKQVLQVHGAYMCAMLCLYSHNYNLRQPSFCYWPFRRMMILCEM